MTRKITLRIVAEDLCGESPTCPVRAKIDEDPNNTYFVGKTDIDCRILDTSEMRLPHIGVRDFWLVDNQRVADMHYDDAGHYLGAELSVDTPRYVAARDALWKAAEPFYSWWDRHPEHRRDQHRQAS